MYFGYSQEDEQLAQTARRLFGPFGDSKCELDGAEAFSLDWVREAALAGIPLMCVEEAQGGLGLGATQANLISREAGRALAPVPVSEVIAGTAVAARVAPDTLEALAAGDGFATFGSGSSLKIDSNGDGWTVSGTLGHVPFGGRARWLSFVAETQGGPMAFCVDMDQRGISRQPIRSTDRKFLLDRVTLDGVNIPATAGLADGICIERLVVLLRTAELVGVAEACLDTAVEHLKQRHQFGKPLGSFQALKHMMADAATQLEGMRVQLDYAVWAHDANTDDAAISASAAKAFAGEGARQVVESAIQCHGGIGFTWEFGMHHRLRRVMRLGAMSGTASDHREAVVNALLQTPSFLAI